MDKNKALIEYLLTCEAIKNSPLYFNFVDAKNGVKQLITLTQDKNIDKPYIDGSELKRYTMTIISYLSISNIPIVKIPGRENENVADFDSIQKLIDWVEVQEANKNYPNFGDNCEIQSISTTTNNPRLDQIDATQSTPLARYSFTIEVQYLDTSKVLWK